MSSSARNLCAGLVVAVGLMCFPTASHATVTISSVSPTTQNSVSGLPATPFRVIVADTAGWADLSKVELLFTTYTPTTTPGSTPHSCVVRYDLVANTYGLMSDDGLTWSAITTGQTSNSQCTLYVTGSSHSGSGTTFTFNASISFTTAFTTTSCGGCSPGYKWQYAYATNAALVNSGFIYKGAWRVSTPPSVGCWTVSPYFSNGYMNDVVAYPVSSLSSPLERTLMTDSGQAWGHVSAITSYFGDSESESYWSGLAPAVGSCATPISPSGLQNLSPGVMHGVHAYGSGVTILKGGAPLSSSAACTAQTVGTYKIHGYGASIANGDCSQFLTSSCGSAYLGGVNVPVSLSQYDTVNDLYNGTVNILEPSISGWATLLCGGITSAQLADRGAMQVLNEIFFGTATQNYNYYKNIQWPNAANHVKANWPATVNPGSTPSGIVAAYTNRVTGTLVSGGNVCGCTSAVGYNYVGGVCQATTMVVVDNSNGAIGTAHRGQTVSLYWDTGAFSTTSNFVGLQLGSTIVYPPVGSQSATQINITVPSNAPVGNDYLWVMFGRPEVGYQGTYVQVY